MGEDEDEDDECVEEEDEVWVGVGLPPRRRRAWLSVGVCPLVDMFGLRWQPQLVLLYCFPSAKLIIVLFSFC
jgi:hypothetical protein